MRYCVDGEAEDGTLQGDGQGAPFRIFDIEAQDHLPGVYADRATPEQAAAILNAGWKASQSKVRDDTAPCGWRFPALEG